MLLTAKPRTEEVGRNAHDDICMIKTVMWYCRLAEPNLIRFDYTCIRNSVNLNQLGSRILLSKTGNRCKCRWTVDGGRHYSNLLSSRLGCPQCGDDMGIEL